MSAAAAAAPEEPPPGSLIGGRFRVEQKLGKGGMGSVYRVCEERTGKRLALKRQTLGGADEQRRALVAAQFEREFHSLAELQHPRIIEVYDYGVDDGTPYYTMELLDGEDLHARKDRPWRESCRLLLDVASSLAILHSRRLLHRDLSPRNVRCTSDGRAKLIDFGAMAAMGAAKTVAGTPMFIPPEALQRQALDGRSDLYSLGALAYWMLTGRYPYPAKTIAELRDVWRSAPPSVKALRPEVPDGVEQLVMELLHLERMARPASAAAVMERLSTAAGLSLTEHAEVPQAYLVTPPLIGRGAQLERARAELVAALGDRAALVLISGDPGTGRSRMLDACVLEAKLLGMVVLRGDADGGGQGEYALARVLCDELLEALPEVAERAAAPRRALLAHVASGLADRDRPAQPAPDRQALHAAILDWWHTCARGRRIAIAVDDADAIDEPSAALLAAIAHRGGRRNISLLVTRGPSTPDTPLALLDDMATKIALAPFDGEETEALMRAVFGDVDHVAPVAAGVHELSDGNPRRAMALAEQLVARGVAQYEAGGWKLPAEIGPGSLPQSPSDEWAERVAALAPDARELFELLALAEPGSLSVEQYAGLTEHGDSGRSYRALDALVSSGLVLPSATRHRFAQRELATSIAGLIPRDRRRALHARLAAALEGHENPLLPIRHLLLAGRSADAIAKLLPLQDDTHLPASFPLLALLEPAVEAAAATGLRKADVVKLQLWLVRVAGLLGDHASFARWSPAMFARLDRESGLADYRELAALPEGERLGAALGRAQQRHDALPEHERVFAPIEAISLLAVLISGAVNVGMLNQDVALLEGLPSLAPLAPLAASLQVVDDLVTGARDFQAGRLRDAVARMERLRARIEQPDHAGLTPEHYREVRLGILYLLGVFAAGSGLPNATELVAELETEPAHRSNAFRVHMTAELMRGNVEGANACQRRAELLALQDGGQLRHRGTSGRIELLAHGMAGDVIGVKRAMERIEAVRAVFPGWEPTLELARAYYRRFQGDPVTALAAVQRGLALVAPGRHMDWSFLSGVRAGLLCDAERYDEGIAAALETWEIHQREGLSGTSEYLLQVLAECFHAAGRNREALDWAEKCVALYHETGRRGLCLGSGYEIRARIAAALGDAVTFEDYAQRCAREYRSGHNAALTMKYERLLRYADKCGIRASAGLTQAADWAQHAAQADSEQLALSIAANLRAYGSGEARGRRTLQLVLEALGTQHGLLFGLQGGQLTLLASTEHEPPPSAIFTFVETFLQSELEESGSATVVGGETVTTRAETDRFTDASGRDFRAILLIGRDGGERRVAGVACAHFASGRSTIADHTRLSVIASAMLDADDLDPLTWVA